MNSNTAMNDRIDIQIFNVGAGDSILIEFCSKVPQYVVIDSNLRKIDNKILNPVYEFLKLKNVKNISTIIISHFHQDHYNGIENLLNNFKIGKIVIPPFLSNKSSQFNKIIDSYKKKIQQFLDRCSDDDLVKKVESLAILLRFLTNNDDILEEVSGTESTLRFPGVNNYTGTVYLPLTKIKGILHNLIVHSDYELNQFPEMNESSIAFSLNCFGYNILLTGDSTINQWNEHKRRMNRDNIENLEIDLLKVPHHGSKYNNNEKLFDYILRKNQTSKYIFVSADGIRHPDKELFDLINKYQLLPYCTNHSKFCLPDNVYPIMPLNKIPHKILPFLINYSESMPIPCQNDIHISISSKGLDVKSSSNVPCVYH